MTARDRTRFTELAQRPAISEPSYISLSTLGRREGEGGDLETRTQHVPSPVFLNERNGLVLLERLGHCSQVHTPFGATEGSGSACNFPAVILTRKEGGPVDQ